MNPALQSISTLAALETLRAAGFSFSAPACARLQLLTVAEVADLLAFERRKVERMVQSGEFPGARMIGSDIRIPVGDVEALIARAPLVFPPLKAAA